MTVKTADSGEVTVLQQATSEHAAEIAANKAAIAEANKRFGELGGLQHSR